MIFTDKQLMNYAKTMIWAMKNARSGQFKPGHIIRVKYYPSTLPLAEIIFRELIKEGYFVDPQMALTAKMERDMYLFSSDALLQMSQPWQEAIARSLNGNIFLWAPDDLFHLSDIPSYKQVMVAKAYKPFRDITTKLEEDGLFGWTLCLWPTSASSSAAGLSIYDYTEQIINACFLDKEDPTKEWEKLIKEAERIKMALNTLGATRFHVESNNINFSIVLGEKRRWMGVSGHNIPSFELFVSPDYRGTLGHYLADLPSYRGGKVIKNVKLHFENGKVIESIATEGNDYLTEQLNADDHAKVVGEFSLTDKRFSRIKKFMANTLYDENFGGDNGNCHIAIGNSYSDTYDGDPSDLTKETKEELGFSDSAIHWDLINTEDKTVDAIFPKKGTLAETKTIYKDGQFTI